MTVGMAMEAGSSPLKCGDWEGGEKRDNGEKRVKKMKKMVTTATKRKEIKKISASTKEGSFKKRGVWIKMA